MMTQTYNRSFYESGEYKNKLKYPVGVVMADINNLKYYNDNYGHKEGDILIRTIVNNMQRYIRPVDVLIRLGVDEFLILLQECDKKDSDKIAIYNQGAGRIEDDEIYQDYEEYNKLYATLRRVHLSIQYVQNDLNNKAALAKMNYRIKDSAPLAKSLPSLELYENLLDSINDTLEKTSNNLPELDASSYTLAKSIIFILKKELLKVHDLIYTGRSE